MAQVKQEGQKQISTIDEDARLLTTIGSKGIVGYNLQSVVDDKNYLIVENEVTNTGDQNALYRMTNNAKELLQVDHISTLADTGYDTGEELMKCSKDGITTYVAPRTQSGSQKDGRFRKDNFTYNKNSDSYICPQENVLSTNGKTYTKKEKVKKIANSKNIRRTIINVKSVNLRMNVLARG